MTLIRGRPRGLPGLDDDERLLAVSVKNENYGTAGVELLSNFLEVFCRRNPLIIDCLDDIAGLQVLRQLRGRIDAHHEHALSVIGYIRLRS